MRIAIISFHHPESSLPLAKHLAVAGNHIDYYYITTLGSESTSAFRFGLKTKKFGITELKKSNNPDLFDYFETELINIRLISLFRMSPKTYFVEKLIIKNVCKKIKKHNYSIINLVGQHELLKVFHENLSVFQRVQTLHEVSPHYLQQKVSGKLINYLIDNKVPVILHSKDSYKRFLKLAGNISLLGFCEHIPFGLFETYKLFKANKVISEDVKYILWYGLVRPYKGLEILNDTIDLLGDKFKEVKIVVAGFGYLPIIDKLKAKSRCIVINRHLTNEDIVTLNKNALFVVCPYTSASQSGIIPTTFLFEKPIIASNVGAIKEYVVHNENGLLIQPDSNELCENILFLLDNNDLYGRLCSGTKNFAIKYSWHSIANDTSNFYCKIINSCINK